MPYRDDLSAALARIAALEAENAALRAGAKADPEFVRGGDRDMNALSVAMFAMVVALCCGMVFGSLMPYDGGGIYVLLTEAVLIGVIGAAWRWWVWQ